MAFSGAKIGAEVGGLFGPEGEVGGAIIGGVLGAAGIAGNLAHRNEAAASGERLPLLQPNPLSGRNIRPVGRVMPTPVTMQQEGLRQRVVRVPGRPSTSDSRIERLQNTERAAQRAIENAARQARMAQRSRIPTIRTSSIPHVIAGAAAAAGTAAAALASQIPGGTASAPPTQPGVTPQPPVTPAPPGNPVTPQAPGVNPTPPVVAPSPPPSPPVIIGPNDLQPETKEPEIPADVLHDHYVNIDARNMRVGNYRLPVYGRHNFVDWTLYTEGNAVASHY